MAKKDETLSRARTQALYLCGLPAFVVFCSVAQLSGTAVWATLWAGIWLAFTVPVPLATLVRDGRARRLMTRRRRRSTDAEAWAKAHGWSHVRASSAVSRSGRDVLRAVRDGVEVASYETIGAPDLVSESPLLTRHAVAARVSGDLPRLIILPEAPVREAGAARWARDIQFESAAFNARWRVHCDDDRFAHAFCHPRVMERLLRPDAVGLSVLVDGRDVIVHAPGNQVLEAVEARAAFAVDLVRLIPPYLLEQHPPRTRRRRRRRPEHSRAAVVLAVLLWGGWLGFLVVLGMAGAVDVALAVGLPSVVVPAAVLVWLARRRAAARGSAAGAGVPISRG